MTHYYSRIKLLYSVYLLSIIILLQSLSAQTIAPISKIKSSPLDRIGTQWAPYIEWGLKNSTFTGNPFDLIAVVTFVHKENDETITTGMFYSGGDVWKFRFTGTKTGLWTFRTISEDSDLNGQYGSVIIEPNPDPNTAGFVTHFGNKWGWSGTNRAFVPQYIMYTSPHAYYNEPDVVDNDIQTFLIEHGFNGMHTMVFCRWFDINEPAYTSIDEPNPDFRTFEALELLITKVHGAGGVVHIWLWGDEQRKQTPIKWGKNGAEDKRLQRYIAARLGPVPGWTMGYGFDLHEWVVEEDLSEWYKYMHEHLGWFHFLGGRDPGPNNAGEPFKQIFEGLDYSSYTQHKPDYNRYVQTIAARPHKPSFSEDRFRIRKKARKDYTFEETRRGLWHSTMAGGVANIWGNLLDGGEGANEGWTASAPYPKIEWIKTYSVFFENRFLKELIRENSISDGVCLKMPTNTHYIFYGEDVDTLQMNLSDMSGAQPAVAVDTKIPYFEINLGEFSPANRKWTAPYKSDWAVAVGIFDTKKPKELR